MDQKTQDELLFHCLGIGAEQIEPSGLEQLSTDDWDAIIQLANRHGVSPLIYYHLKETGILKQIQDEVMRRLRNIYLFSAETNIRRCHEFSKMLRMSNKDGIPIIVLKGAALAEMIYQNIALRPMADVDLLIKGKDAQRIDRILSQLGYRSNRLSDHHMQWDQVNYTSKSLQIELHPTLPELPDLDPWINAFAIKISATDTLVLGYEDLLLHLCLHINAHLRVDKSSRLIWWYDIAKLLDHYQKELDWDYIIGITRKYKVEATICRMLRTISKWFDGDVPADVLDRFKNDGVAMSLGNILYPAGYTEEERKKTRSRDMDINLVASSISVMLSTDSKIRYLFRTIFPSRKYIMQHYSVTRPGLVWFYYLVRIKKLTKRAARALWQLPIYLKNKNASPGD